MIPVAILCGGRGTRLSPLTDHIPKSLVDVCGKPFIVRQLDLLARHGYTDIVLLIGHLGKQIMEVVGDGSAFGVNVRYSDDGANLKERDDAIWQSPAWTESDACFVLYGDSYLDCDYANIEKLFMLSSATALETTYRGEGYGLRAFKNVGAMMLESPVRYEEIGSHYGLARVRELFKDEPCQTIQ